MNNSECGRAVRGPAGGPPALHLEIARCGASVRVGYPRILRLFLRGYLAITIGRTIYLAPRLLERGEEVVARTLRHELAHVRQIARLGLVRFYLQYMGEYLRLRLARLTHEQAYDAISFEREARAAASEEGTPV